MKKNGFTLIEIIICIALVSIIGSISVISFSKMNEEGKIRKELENILQTYLSVNSSILHNIGPNAEGAIVPLNVLYNQGLMDDNIAETLQKDNINLEEDYFILADAVQPPVGGNVSQECNNVEGILIKGSWDIDNEEVIYICPRDYSNNSNVIQQVKMYNYFPKGKNPNNFVKVKNGDKESIWRILEINEGVVRLIGYEDKLFIDASESAANSFEPYKDYKDTNFLSEYFDDRYIKKDTYVFQHSVRPGTQLIDISVPSISYESYVGIVDYLTLINAGANDGNWIYDFMKTYVSTKSKYVVIGLYQHNNGIFGFRKNTVDSYYESDVGIETVGNSVNNKYSPVIRIDECLKLLADSTCSVSHAVGSENCPYILDNTGC